MRLSQEGRKATETSRIKIKNKRVRQFAALAIICEPQTHTHLFTDGQQAANKPTARVHMCMIHRMRFSYCCHSSVRNKGLEDVEIGRQHRAGCVWECGVILTAE